MKRKFQDNFLVALIDDLRPVNNEFRQTKDAIGKIKLMWRIGCRIDQALNESEAKLHELLYTLYDPYGSNKMSYITRDLCSYSYRIYKYFVKEDEIEKLLPNLTSYSLFREAIPLIFNDKYNLDEAEKLKIIRLIQSDGSPSHIIRQLKILKQKINPKKNPRNQRAAQFVDESTWLFMIKNNAAQLYKENEALPALDNWKLNSLQREQLVKILLAIASDSYSGKVSTLKEEDLIEPLQPLLRVAKADTQEKARFRKWAMNASGLFSLGEIINGMNSDVTYKLVRSKIIDR